MRFKKLHMDAFDSWNVVAPHSKDTTWNKEWTCNTNRGIGDSTNYCYFVRCTDHLSHDKEKTERNPSLAWRYCADDHPTKSNWLEVLKSTKNTDAHYRDTVDLISAISEGTTAIGWEIDWVCSDASEHTKYLCPISNKRKLQCDICKKKREFDDWSLMTGSEPLVNGTVFEAGTDGIRTMNKWACGSRLIKYRLRRETEWVSADVIYMKKDGFIENEETDRGVEFSYCDFHQCIKCGQWRLLDERSTWYKFVHEILRQKGFSEDEIKQKALPHKTDQEADMSKWACTEGMCYIKSSVESLDEPEILYSLHSSPTSESEPDDSETAEEDKVEAMCLLCKNKKDATKKSLDVIREHEIQFVCLFDYGECTGPDTEEEQEETPEPNSDETAKADQPVKPKQKRATLPPGSEVNLFRVRDYTKLDANEAQKALISEMTKIKAKWGDKTHEAVSKLIVKFDTKDEKSTYDGLLFWLLLHTTVEAWVYIAVSDDEDTKSGWMYYPPGLRLATSDDPGDDGSSDDEDGGYGEATVRAALETERTTRLVVDGVGDWNISKLREGLLVLEPGLRLKLARNEDDGQLATQVIDRTKKSVLGIKGRSDILDAAVKQITKITNETIKEDEDKLRARQSSDRMKYYAKYRNPYLALFARNAIFQSMVEEDDEETDDENEEETERDEEEIRVSYLREIAKIILAYLVGDSAGKIAFDALYKLAERGDDFAYLMESKHVRQAEFKSAYLLEFYEGIRELDPIKADKKMSDEFVFGLDTLIRDLEPGDEGEEASADRRGLFDTNIAKLLTARRDEAREKRRTDKIAERNERVDYEYEEDGSTEEAEAEAEEEEEEEDESEGGLEDLVQRLLIEVHIHKEVGVLADASPNINKLRKEIGKVSGETENEETKGKYNLERILVAAAIKAKASELQKIKLKLNELNETLARAHDHDGSDEAKKKATKKAFALSIAFISLISAYRSSLEAEIRKIREANEKEREETTRAKHLSKLEAKEKTVDPWPAKIFKDVASSLLEDWKNEALDAIQVPSNVTEPADQAALKWNAMRLARDAIARCRVQRFITGDRLVKTRDEAEETDEKETEEADEKEAEEADEKETEEADEKEAEEAEGKNEEAEKAPLEFESNECSYVPSTLNVEGTFTTWEELSKVSLEEKYVLYAKTSDPLSLIETDNYRYAAIVFAYAKSKNANEKTLGAIIQEYDTYINSSDRDGDPAKTMFRRVGEILTEAEIDAPAWWKYHDDDSDSIVDPILEWLNAKGQVKWATEAIQGLSAYRPHPFKLKAEHMATMLSVIEKVWRNKDTDFDKGLSVRAVSRLVDDIYARGRFGSMLEYYEESAHEHAMKHIVSLPALVDVDATVGAINRANKRTQKKRKTSPIIADSYYDSDIARKYGFVSQSSLNLLSSLAFKSESASLYAHSMNIGADFIYKCREHTRLVDEIPHLYEARDLAAELHELFEGSGSIVDKPEEEKLEKATEIMHRARSMFDANLQVPTMMVAYRPGHDKRELNSPGWLLSRSEHALEYIHSAYERIWKLTVGIKNKLEAIKTEVKIYRIDKTRGPMRASYSKLKNDLNDRARELREMTPLAIAWPEQTTIQDLAYGASYKRAVIGTAASLMSFYGAEVGNNKAECEAHFIDVLIARHAFLRPSFLTQKPEDYKGYIARDLTLVVPSDVERIDLSAYLATKITDRLGANPTLADRRPIDMPDKAGFNDGYEVDSYNRILAISGALRRVKPINSKVAAAALYMFERDDDREWTAKEKSESNEAISMRRDRIRLLLAKMLTFIQQHERVKDAIKNKEMVHMITGASSSFGMNERQRRLEEKIKREQEDKSGADAHNTKTVRVLGLEKKAAESRVDVLVRLLLRCVLAVLDAVSILTGATVRSVHDELLAMISDARTKQERESDEKQERVKAAAAALFSTSKDEKKPVIPKKSSVEGDQENQEFGAKNPYDRTKLIDVDFPDDDAVYIDKKVPLVLPYYRLADYNDGCAAYRRVGEEHADVYILHSDHKPYMNLLEDLQLDKKREYKVSDVQERLDKASSAVKKQARLIVLYFDTTKDNRRVLRPATPRVTGTYYCVGNVKVLGSSEVMPSQYQPLNLPFEVPTPVTHGSVAYISLLCDMAGIGAILDRKKGSEVITITQAGLSKLQNALTTASLRLALFATDRVFFFVIKDGKLKLDSSTIRDLFYVEDQEVRNIHDIRTARDDNSFGMRAFV